MKLGAQELLFEALDKCLAWRRKEISALGLAVESASHNSPAKKLALRSGVALLYAHWEGFVKESSEKYVEYVSAQVLKNEQLADNFLYISARSELQEVLESHQMDRGLALIGFFRDKMEEQSNIPPRHSINTKSNLKSDVLREIAQRIGVNYSLFETKERLIDEGLLKKRNSIAHGEHLLVDEADFKRLVEGISEMMTTWSNELQNACATKRFTRAGLSAAAPNVPSLTTPAVTETPH